MAPSTQRSPLVAPRRRFAAARHRPWLALQRGALLALLLSALASSAEGQSAADAEARYQNSVRQALQEYGLGHWNEAKAFFQQAHALQPSARTLRGLALTDYELREYVGALGYAEQALTNGVRPLTEEMRREIEALRDKARHFVARAHVRLEPASAQLHVDGRPAVLDADSNLLLNPGAHELAAEAKGFAPEARKVEAQSGDQLEIELALHPSTLASAQPAVPAGDREARPRSLAPWFVVAGSGAIAVTGIVLFALAQHDIAQVEGAKKGTRYADVKDAGDRAPALSGIGIALLAAGAAGVAAGLAWELWPPQREAANAHARLSLAPSGARLEGSF